MDNKELVISFFVEGYINHNYDFIMECMAEDYIDHSPAGARSNADAVGILKIVEGQFSDLKIEVLDVFGQENMVATRILYQGIHAGTCMGIPATGKHISFEALENFKVVDGKIVALNIASDKTGKIVYSFGYTRNVANEEDAEQEQKPNIEALKSLLDKNGIRMETVFELYKIKSEEEITASKYANIIKNLDKIKQKQDEKGDKA